MYKGNTFPPKRKQNKLVELMDVSRVQRLYICSCQVRPFKGAMVHLLYITMSQRNYSQTKACQPIHFTVLLARTFDPGH